MTFKAGNVQGGIPFIFSTYINLSTSGEQEIDNLQVPALASQVQGSVAITIA
jgi:hypothetical protein